MPESKLQFDVKETSKVTLEKKIKRGKESWKFIYSVFSILLALTLFFISILPIRWLYKITIFIIVIPILIYLFLFNAWFQNKLIGLKIKLEETWRKI